ncbi:DUF4115 domain-containing protein [Marinobacteraceae bacterium S3BR75-40.1]
MSEAEPSPDIPVCGHAGQRLREAREAKGWDVITVADQLHLRPSVVDAIESGDYRQVPGELFLKGYVRTYARLLELNADSLLESLEAELEPFRQEQQEEQKKVSPIEDIQQRKQRRRRVATLIVFALFLVVLGFLYYRMEQTGIAPPIPEPSGTSAEESQQAAPPEAVPEGEQAAGDQTESLPAPSTAETTSETPLAQPEPESPAPAPDSESAPASRAETTAEPLPEASPQPQAAPAEQEAPAAAAETEKAVAAQTLYMGFSDDCWVEVKNANGTTVVAALKRDGDTVEYTGQGPFRIVIGNMDALDRLAFNGRAVDVTKFPVRNGRSEFTLSQDTLE